MTSETAFYEEIDAVEKNYDIANNVCYEDPKKAVVASKLHRESSTSQHSRCNKCIFILSVAVVALVFCFMAVCTIFAVKISMLKSGQATSMQQIISTVSERLDSVALQVNASTDTFLQQLAQDLYSTLNTKIGSTRQQFVESYSEINSRVEQLTASLFSSLPFGQRKNVPAPSCVSLPPSSPSGYYWVRASNGSAVHVYCDMTRSCGGATGGWMRVAELDMTNSSHRCPGGLTQRRYPNKRLCARRQSSGGCSTVTISTSNIRYSSVCGRVIAYQYGAPDAFYMLSINSTYVDGVSLTHGNPRKHIWTFAAATDEVSIEDNSCPCIRSDLISRANSKIPSFVGDDYFCDTGSQNHYQLILYSDNPLWDGVGCGSQSTCCSFNNPPWFYKQLPQPTTDDIEMRLCRNYLRTNEDIAIEMANIYVR